MSGFSAFLSGIAGISVLIGYFFPPLNDSYYLILFGGILALISAAMATKSRKRAKLKSSYASNPSR